MYETRVTKKGQTTIPLELREQTGIEEEKSVVWYKEGHRLVLEPKKRFKDSLKALDEIKLKTKKSSKQLAQEVEDEF